MHSPQPRRRLPANCACASWRALPLAWVAVAVLVLAASAAPSAWAAGRRVPPHFMGVYWGNTAIDAPPSVQDEQWRLMARSGVESVRTVFNWAEAQPSREAPPDWTRIDAVVARAAVNGLDLLAVIYPAPTWARLTTRPSAPPRDPAALAAFLQQLIARYGPQGSFWNEHPELPRRPVRQWQIWNEPHYRINWDVARSDPGASRHRFPEGYVRVLCGAYRAIKRADRGATVVLAGLTEDAWRYLAQIYRAGGRGCFDVVASQTFTGKPKNLLVTLDNVRATMRRYHDSRRALWITETSWPAARGRTRYPRGQSPFVTTDSGMAKRLRELYRLAARAVRDPQIRLGRVYWYEWSSAYRAPAWIFDYSGLLRIEPDWRFEPMPALAAYRTVARELTGRRL